MSTPISYGPPEYNLVLTAVTSAASLLEQSGHRILYQVSSLEDPNWFAICSEDDKTNQLVLTDLLVKKHDDTVIYDGIVATPSEFERKVAHQNTLLETLDITHGTAQHLRYDTIEATMYDNGKALLKHNINVSTVMNNHELAYLNSMLHRINWLRDTWQSPGASPNEINAALDSLAKTLREFGAKDE